MKSTDIPNGIVFRGMNGEVLLIELDDHGRMEESVSEIGTFKSKRNEVYGDDPYNVLSFVHIVRGESQILIKDIFSVYTMGSNKKPLAVYDMLQSGKLADMTMDLRNDYIRVRRMIELSPRFEFKNGKFSKKAGKKL